MSRLDRGEVWLVDLGYFTIPHAKLLRKLGTLTSEQMAEVEKVLLFWLGFEKVEEDEK